MFKEPIPLIAEDDIYNKIVELYESNKFFIVHIIRSNFPQKTKRVISFTNENLKNRRCCISDAQLTDLSTIAKNMSRRDTIPYDVIIHSLSDIRTPVHIINNEADGKTLALIGEKSDRMLSIAGFNQLMRFVSDRFNDNDIIIQRALYQEFCNMFKKDILKRFDLSISYTKLPNVIKKQFEIYVLERFIPTITNVDINFIWDYISGRK